MDEDDVRVSLRGLLLSTKAGLSAIQLKADLIQTCGMVDFRKFNCANLEEFVLKYPRDFRLYGGSILAVPKDSSKHISHLVRGQSSKGAKPGGLTNINVPMRKPNKPIKPLSTISTNLPAPVPNLGRDKRKVRLLPPRILKTILESNNQNKITPIPATQPLKKFSSSENIPREVYKHPTALQVPAKTKDRKTTPVNIENQPDFQIKRTIINENYNTPVFTPLFDTVEPLLPITLFPEPEPLKQNPPSVKSEPLKQVQISSRANARLSRLREKQQVAIGIPPTVVPPLLTKTEPPKPNPVWPKSSNIIRDLAKVCVMKNMPAPEFICNSVKYENKTLWYGTLKVGDRKVFSYPHDCLTMEESHKCCAKKAYDILTSNTVMILPKTRDISLFITRLLTEWPNGAYMNNLEEEYSKKYSELPPHYWEDVVSISSQFVIENTSDGAFFKRNVNNKESKRVVDCVSNVIPTSKTAYQKKTEDGNNNIKSFECDLPKNCLNLIKTPDALRRLPALIPPDDQYWDLYVTHIKDNSVYCRIIGAHYSVEYDNLMLELDVKLLGKKAGVANPELNGLYAVRLNENAFRVLITALNDNAKSATVYLLDTGEEEEVCYYELMELDDEFLNFPPQAFLVSLHGLEALPKIPLVNKILSSKLLLRVIVAEVLTFYGAKPFASIIFYDTSTKYDVNINTLIVEDVLKELVPPTLDKESLLFEDMLIANVSAAGAIFLKSTNLAVDCMVTAIDYLFENSAKLLKPLTIDKICSREMYLAMSPYTKKNCRGTILEMNQTTNSIHIFFIDHGNDAWIPVKKLIHCSEVSEVLNQVPALTLKVALDGIDVLTPGMINLVKKIAWNDEIVKVKVINVENGLPNVEIQHYDESNNLQFLNNVLKFSTFKDSEELFDDDVEPLHSCKTEQLFDVLLTPEVPEKDGYFNVQVIMAASPYNMVVQPLDSEPQLEEVMHKLQSYCKKSLIMLEENELKIGKVYGVLNTDENWYRGCLKGILGTYALSVYLIDFGSLIVVPIENLRDLPGEFFELPYQSIRAKLAGIKPIGGDWSPPDCIMFTEMISNKDFVAIVVNDSLEDDFMCLELKLVDTSNHEQDIFIHEKLIEMGIAVSVK